MTLNCPFCPNNRTSKDPALLTNRTCFLLRTADTVLSCGGMIIPYRHVATPFELNQEEWNDAFDLLLRAKLLFDEEGAQAGWGAYELTTFAQPIAAIASATIAALSEGTSVNLIKQRLHSPLIWRKTVRQPK